MTAVLEIFCIRFIWKDVLYSKCILRRPDESIDPDEVVDRYVVKVLVVCYLGWFYAERTSIGKEHSNSMPHIHEKIDFTVSAWIVYNDRVLLVFHKGQQTWLPIGGHIELDEDPEEALWREVKEECGLDIELIGETRNSDYPSGGYAKFLLMPAYLDIHPINDTHRHIALEYFAKAKSDRVHLADGEHDAIRWFTLRELDDPRYDILPNVKFLAKEALRKVAY